MFLRTTDIVIIIAIETKRKHSLCLEQAQPLFREPKKFPDMADPDLKKQFPERGLNQAVAIAAMCLQDEAAARPLMSDVVTALSYLSVASEENKIPPALPPSISSKLHCISDKLSRECGGDGGNQEMVGEQGDHAQSDTEPDANDRSDKESGSSPRSSSSNAKPKPHEKKRL